MTNRFVRNPELGLLPPKIAYIVQAEVNNFVEQTGQKYAYTEQIMDLLYDAIDYDPEAFGFTSADQQMTMQEIADTYLPQILWPAPILLVDNAA